MTLSDIVSYCLAHCKDGMQHLLSHLRSKPVPSRPTFQDGPGPSSANVFASSGAVSGSLPGNSTHAAAVNPSRKLDQSATAAGKGGTFTTVHANGNPPCSPDASQKSAAASGLDAHGPAHATESLLNKGSMQAAGSGKVALGCSSHTLVPAGVRQPQSGDPALDALSLGSQLPGTGADRKRSWATRELQGLNSVVVSVVGSRPLGQACKLMLMEQ